MKYVNTKQTLKFLDSLRVGHTRAYRVSQAALQPTAIASATAASAMNFMGFLKDISEQDRQDWIEYLNRFIDADGLITDAIDFAKPTQTQPLWALRAHRTRHVGWAIEALGGKLDVSIEFMKPYMDRQSIIKWLNEIWRDKWQGGFWAAGNWLMDMCVLLDFQYRHFSDAAAYETILCLLRALAKRLQPNTGFWRGPNDDDRNAMAGSMHLFPFYWAYQVELPYFDNAVRQTLTLQQKDGLFAYEIGSGGSQCLDYDAMLILVNGDVLFPELKDEIKSAATRTLKAIQLNRQPSGSWSDCLLDEFRYWATEACMYKANQGSIWDTYARIMTIAMCEKIVNGQLPGWANAENHVFEMVDAGKGWRNGHNPHIMRQG